MAFVNRLFHSFIGRLGIIIPIVVILILLIGIISEWDGLRSFPWSINPYFLLISASAYACQLLLMFMIWHFIMGEIDGQRNIKLNLNAFFYSSLAKRIPTVVPFLGARFQLYKKNSQSASSSVFIGSIFEIVVLLISGGMFISISGIIFDSITFPYSFTWIISLLLGLFLLFPKFYKSLIGVINNKFGTKIVCPALSPKTFLSLIGISLVTYVFNAIAIYFLMIGITKQPLAFQDTITASSFYYLLTYVTMYLVGGFGIKEMVFGFMMRPHFVFSIGVLIAFIIRLMMIFVEAIAYIFVRRYSKVENISW